MPRILVLGAGLVARPGVRYLLDLPDVQLSLADMDITKAEAIIDGHPRGQALALDVGEEGALDKLIATHDLSISLLPAHLHPIVAEYCLRHGKNMVTASYVSEAMMALDAPAKKAGLLFINECGVDPGIDHMSAMKIFDDVHARGGRVRVFKSYCGGLPAPEANTNPLGYKFSWAPRGVLVAARNSALYKWNGEVRRIAPDDLLMDNHPLHVDGAGDFEAYPNRDSMQYQQIYGLGELETLYRATLRTPGHCARWKAWIDLGLFELHTVPAATRADMTRAVLEAPADADLRQLAADAMGVPVDHDHVAVLDWLGMFEPIPLRADTPLDAMAEAMVERAGYADGERDMLAMHHEVISDFDDHSERTTMDMVDFGVPHGDSSMARTVSLPVAIATRLLLEGRFNARGVVRPVTAELYAPILDELDSLGIRCVEQTERL